LPVLEQWCDLFYPADITADILIDFRDDPGLKLKFKEVHNQYRKQILQDKLINPEFAFIIRADLGLHYLLRELGAKVNISEIFRRVASAPSVNQPG